MTKSGVTLVTRLGGWSRSSSDLALVSSRPHQRQLGTRALEIVVAIAVQLVADAIRAVIAGEG